MSRWYVHQLNTEITLVCIIYDVIFIAGASGCPMLIEFHIVLSLARASLVTLLQIANSWIRPHDGQNRSVVVLTHGTVHVIPVDNSPIEGK